MDEKFYETIIFCRKFERELRESIKKRMKRNEIIFTEKKYKSLGVKDYSAENKQSSSFESIQKYMNINQFFKLNFLLYLSVFGRCSTVVWPDNNNNR